MLNLGVASLAASNYPMVLVATKCDHPEDMRELDTASVAAAYPAVVANFSISANAPNTTRECMQVILRAIVASRNGNQPCPIPRIPGCFYLGVSRTSLPPRSLPLLYSFMPSPSVSTNTDALLQVKR